MKRPQFQIIMLQTPSPAAKKNDERGINSSDIKGSGRGGRITKNDALNAIPSMGSKLNGVSVSKIVKNFQCLEEKLQND